MGKNDCGHEGRRGLGDKAGRIAQRGDHHAYINVEEVEDEMEPRRRPAEQMVCDCWTIIVYYYHINTATESNRSRVA